MNQMRLDKTGSHTRATLYGVGVGPGRPEWITLEAYHILTTVPVVAYPKSHMKKESYALKIVASYLHPEEQELLGLYFPMTRDQEQLVQGWREVVRQIWEHLEKGKSVAFVTEGDPLMFSTFIYLKSLMEAFHPQVQVRAIPGISSVNGAAARLCLPLADSDQRLAVIPAIEDKEAMRQVLVFNDTVVFIKMAKVLEMIIQLLEEMDLVSCARVVSQAGSPQEEVFDNVAALKGQKLPYLSLMIVKKPT